MSSSYILLLILAAGARLTFCACIKSYSIICDSMQDVLDIPKSNKSFWKELHIQSDEHVTPYTLKGEHLNYLESLERLVIVRQLNGISLTNKREFYLAGKEEIRKNFILYDNDLKLLAEGTVYKKKVNLLSLENNKIEKIAWKAFYELEADTVDFSYNQLSILSRETFIRSSVSKLILRHNKISKIEKGSLPLGLKYLYLDYNELELFNEFQVFHSDTLRLDIEELTISHNKLAHIGDFSALQNLQQLDLSFNNLFTVGHSFDKLGKLELLNLEHNYLVEFSFPTFLATEPKHRKIGCCINLAYNGLTDLKFPPIQRKIDNLELRGNPWNCACYRGMEKKLLEFPFYVQSACEKQLFSSGRFPYCFASTLRTEFDIGCLQDQITEEELKFFQQSITNDSCSGEDEFDFNFKCFVTVHMEHLN